MKKLMFVLIATMFLVPVVLAVNQKQTEPLDKITFIHYKDGTIKEVGKAVSRETCYKLMGVKWNTLPVKYVINPTNPQGLTQKFVTSTISTSAETWDAATSKELFGDSFSVNDKVQYGVQDDQNAITFGDYSNNNVIAVTAVWYTRHGKQIVEFDQLYNTRFTWGDATSNPAVMDLQNIATHELGHAVGLSDLYTPTCTAVTMFGYSNNGEIQKRTPESADITGLQKMYGV